ncbi:MAG: asparagine synthase-related protein [Bacteroidota bacterium]
MITFLPSDNKGFPWFQQNHIYCKGYLFLRDEPVWGEALCRYFDVNDKNTFENRVKHANGEFAVVVIKENTVFAATDRLRTYPLFYKYRAQHMVISDLPEKLLDSNDQSLSNSKIISRFQACGFVPGSDTLIPDIKQIEAGTIFSFVHGQQPISNAYFSFASSNSIETTEHQAELHLIKTIGAVFARYKTIFQQRQLVIPLSGGFDSRLIAVMIKSMGLKNVICFTYGPKESKEVEVSKAVAGKLGFTWMHIPLTTRALKEYPADRQFQNYMHYAARYSSMFYMQEYFPVQYLKELDLIDHDALFIPGHSADFIAGSHLNQQIIQSKNTKQLAEHIYNQYFKLVPEPIENQQKTIAHIYEALQKKTNTTQPEVVPYRIFEDWVLKERQAKFIINSSKVYSFFGYAAVHPLWDNQLVDFFSLLPLAYRLNKTLYDKALLSRIFKPYHVDFNPYQAKKPLIKQHPTTKFWIKKHLPKQIRLQKLKQSDTINYYPITQELMRDMKNKQQKFSHPYNDFNEILVQYYIQQLQLASTFKKSD